MINGIVDALEETLERLTLRRLTALVLVTVVVGGAIWGYESYTDHFRLERVSRGAHVLERLASLGQHPGVKASPQLMREHARLVREFHLVLDSHAHPTSVLGTFNVPRHLLVFLASAWPYYSISLVALALILKGRDTHATYGIAAGMPVFGVAWSTLGVVMFFDASWTALFGFGAGNFMLTMLLILLIQRVRQARGRKSAD